MKVAAGLIANFGEAEINAIESSPETPYQLEVAGETYALDYSDFEISAEEIPGWQVAQDGEITVALDISLNDDLIAEGMARELVNRIQGIRREMDLNVTDKIKIIIQEHDSLTNAVSKYGDYIKSEVLGEQLSFGDGSGGVEIELPGDIKLLLKIEKA